MMDFLPMPHRIKHTEGVYTLYENTKIVLEGTKPEALLYAQILQADIARHTGLEIAILRGVGRQGDIILRMDAQIDPDAYRISVAQDGITVSGGSGESLLNGVVTLSQWIHRHGGLLPGIEIEDKPDLKHRGYYLDCSRGRVSTLETLKRYADLLCRYKVNQWQLYIEHTYLFRDLTEATRGETPLTAEEIMTLDAYCRARHIELVPSLSSFGHMYRILSTKTHSELCELSDSDKIPFSYTYAGDHHTLNVSHPDAMPFIKQLIQEYKALFSSDKFNICCDETFDLGKGKSFPLAEEKGTHTLYMAHVTELCRWLLDQGVTPMFWGDIMWRKPEAYKDIPKGVICLNWGYLPNQRENEVRDLAQMGATQYVCPGVCTWNRWLPLMQDSYNNIRRMCEHGHKYGAIGLLNTDWGDYGHICQPSFSLPGILYGAAFAWNAKEIPFEEINQTIGFLEFGDDSGLFMNAFHHMTENEVFLWTNAVRFIEESDPAKQAQYFSDTDVSRVPQANAAIDSAIQMLFKAAPYMDMDKRPIIHDLMLAARGVKLWNDIAVWIAKTPDAKDGKHLATELESWYAAYITAWRKVSKESTSRLTFNLICAWADKLRG